VSERDDIRDGRLHEIAPGLYLSIPKPGGEGYFDRGREIGADDGWTPVGKGLPKPAPGSNISDWVFVTILGPDGDRWGGRDYYDHESPAGWGESEQGGCVVLAWQSCPQLWAGDASGAAQEGDGGAIGGGEGSGASKAQDALQRPSEAPWQGDGGERS